MTRCTDLTRAPGGWLQCVLESDHERHDPLSLHQIDPSGPVITLQFTADGFVNVPAELGEYAVPPEGPFAVECPECYAPPGRQCFDQDFGGPTDRVHWKRWAVSETVPPPEVTW